MQQVGQGSGVEDVGPAAGRGGEGLEEEPAGEHLLAVDARPDLGELRGSVVGIRGEHRAVERADARPDHEIRAQVGVRERLQHAELHRPAGAAAAEHVGERPRDHVRQRDHLRHVPIVPPARTVCRVMTWACARKPAHVMT